MVTAAAYRHLTQQLSAVYDPAEAQSIARIVMEDVFGQSPNSDKALAPEQLDLLENITARLLKKEPVQYVLGQADFYGLKFEVSPAVLIPRQETEVLVHQIIQHTADRSLQFLDIGTGSGCIPITIKKHCPNMTASGWDISPAALEIARKNADLNGVEIRWQQIDILNRNAWENAGKWDIIASNPPYIPLRESHLVPDHVARYEPHLALFVDDTDPLIFYRTILDFAIEHLSPGGRLYFELNEFNAGEVAELARAKGFAEVTILRDLRGKERVLRVRG
ncbi:MAG TPA: peptide chain release factor N(5)-glutamine methyltransferase [Flavilitoribacter sp.]|nr:peptide chain release factor N(5)-glutamine methyltransferase [Flavilitoribacter sp.]HMQ90460.1 peptide chain release factor N(5)-glutamine methyltransferase [Flavilitoribacter sp.]